MREVAVGDVFDEAVGAAFYAVNELAVAAGDVFQGAACRVFGDERAVVEVRVVGALGDGGVIDGGGFELGTLQARRGVQSELPPGVRSRFLYYWAKEYSGELQRGDEYPQLIPVISIIWLGSNLLDGEKFHSIFHISEDTTRERFTSDLEIHTLELKKLRHLSEANQPQLYRWSRFLLAETDEELDKLAKEDPVMQTAKSTLEAISADPGAQSLVREREMARRAHEPLLYSARIAGRAEGEAKGEAKSILAVLEARGISVSEDQRQRIFECTDLERLSAWVRKAVTLTDVDELFRD